MQGFDPLGKIFKHLENFPVLTALLFLEHVYVGWVSSHKGLQSVCHKRM